MKSEKDREKLYKLFTEGSANIKIKPEYWAHGGDEGFSYCYECCEKEVIRLQKLDPENKDDYCVDGGWGTEGDSIAYCETCGHLLENSLTDCGAEDEVRHFLGYGFDPKSENDCHSMGLVIDARGWEPWKDRIYRDEVEKKNDLEYYEKLNQLCIKILNYRMG
jgi:hypothetical protein